MSERTRIPTDPTNGARPTARYVAIITDGSGRWAQERGLPIASGEQRLSNFMLWRRFGGR